MKSILLSALAVLSFSCGGPLTYGGQLSEAATREGVSSRTVREAEFQVTPREQQLIIDGWEAPLIATIDGAALTFEPGGEVLGGVGSYSAGRLSFTILTSVRQPGQPVGFASLSFDGALGATIDESRMPDSVHSGHEELPPVLTLGGDQPQLSAR